MLFIFLAVTALILAGVAVYLSGFQAGGGEVPLPPADVVWVFVGFVLTILIVQFQFFWQHRQTIDLQREEARQGLKASLYRELSGSLRSLKSISLNSAQLSYDLAIAASFEVPPLLPHDRLEELDRIHRNLIKSVDEAVALVDSYLIISDELSSLNESLQEYGSHLSNSYRAVLVSRGEGPSPELHGALRSYSNTVHSLHSTASGLLVLAQNTLLGDLFESVLEEIPDREAGELEVSSQFALEILAKVRQIKRIGEIEDRQLIRVGLTIWKHQPSVGFKLLRLPDSVPAPEEVAELTGESLEDKAYSTILRSIYDDFIRKSDNPERASILIELVKKNPDAAILWLEVMDIASAAEVLEIADDVSLKPAIEQELESVRAQWRSHISRDVAVRIIAEDAVITAGSNAVFTIAVRNSTESVLPISFIRALVDRMIPRDLVPADLTLASGFTEAVEIDVKETEAILSIKDLPATSEFIDLATISFPTESSPGTVCVRIEASLDEGFEQTIEDVSCITLTTGPELDLFKSSGFIDRGGVFQSAKTHFRVGETEDDFAYQLIVTNRGSEVLSGLIIRDSLLRGSDRATLDSIRAGFPTKGRAQLGTAALDWEVGVLAGGESAEIQFYATAKSEGRVISRTSAFADQLAGLVIQESESVIER